MQYYRPEVFVGMLWWCCFLCGYLNPGVIIRLWAAHQGSLRYNNFQGPRTQKNISDATYIYVLYVIHAPTYAEKVYTIYAPDISRIHLLGDPKTSEGACPCNQRSATRPPLRAKFSSQEKRSLKEILELGTALTAHANPPSTLTRVR